MSDKIATKETVLKFAAELNELCNKYKFFMANSTQGIEVYQLHNGKDIGLFSQWEFPADLEYLKESVFS